MPNELRARALPLDGPRPGSRARQVFVNRNLRLDRVDVIGFDMDYTLAVYHKRRVEELSFQMTLERLVSQLGYPAAISGIAYDPAFVVRGLVIDTETGHIIKVDRHNHVGRGYHGRTPLASEVLKTTYRHARVRLGTTRYAWIDTLFALPEACLYASIVEESSRLGQPVDHRKLYDDIRATIDGVHRDGSLKAVIQQDLAHYFHKDPELGPALHKLRSAGKKLFLATNSFWEYTDAVMSHLLDGALAEYPRWERYFDWVLVGAGKPGFFSEHAPFKELDARGQVVAETRDVERGRTYQGGNLADFERSTGFGGDRILYVGDHIYGDILRSKKHSMWRTCLVIEELEDEIRHAERRSDDLNHQKAALAALERRLERDPELSHHLRTELETARAKGKADVDQLRKTLRETTRHAAELEGDVERTYNPYWGFVFKEGNENSRFGQQVEDYACLYTSRVTNFLYVSPMQYFRAPRETMPHERG